MDLMTGFMGAVLTMIVGALLAEQAKASAPLIAKWIVLRAVSKAPQELQARLEEEWLAVVQDTAGPLHKIWIAVGFRWSVAALIREAIPVPEASTRSSSGRSQVAQVSSFLLTTLKRSLFLKLMLVGAGLAVVSNLLVETIFKFGEWLTFVVRLD